MNKCYKIDNLIFKLEGLKVIKDKINECLNCTKPNCNTCDKPYFTMLPYLHSKCYLRSTQCVNLCNPLECEVFLEQIETKKSKCIVPRLAVGKILFNSVKHNPDKSIKLNITTPPKKPKLYKIADTIVECKGLSKLKSVILNCIECKNKTCNCDKPYYVILDYLRNTCYHDCLESDCDCLESDCDTCNPLEDYGDHLLNVKTKKPVHYTKALNSVIDSICDKLQSRLLKDYIADIRNIKPKEKPKMFEGYYISGKVYSEDNLKARSLEVNTCLNCKKVNFCKDCHNRRILLAHTYLRSFCNKNECKHKNCFKCILNNETNKVEFLNINLIENIISHMFESNLNSQVSNVLKMLLGFTKQID